MIKSVIVAFSIAILGFSIYGLYVPDTVLETFLTINEPWTYARVGVAVFFLAFAFIDELRQNFLRSLFGIAGAVAIIVGALSFVILSTLVLDFFIFTVGGIFALLASLDLKPAQNQLITTQKLAALLHHVPKTSIEHLNTGNRKATV